LATRALAALIVLLSALGVTMALNAHPASASTQGDAIAAKAASMAGTPYCDGGGTINGPTFGGESEAGCPTGTKGFDCMSLVQYAVYQVTGIALPAAAPPTQSQLAPGQTETTFGPTDLSDLQPGDATYWGGGAGPISSYSHSGIYAGNGEVWDAVGTQQPVQEHSFAQLESSAHNYTYLGAIRWSSGTTSSFAVTTTSLPGGSVSTKAHKITYSATLAASGGTTPYHWALNSGSSPLPPGLKLNSKGVISGKAKTAGTYPFTVLVKDKKVKGVQQSATASLSITIS
jgi:cell wall-associated NlpC family hydrolase